MHSVQFRTDQNGKPVDNITGTLLVAASQATVMAPERVAAVTVFVRDDTNGCWSRKELPRCVAGFLYLVLQHCNPVLQPHFLFFAHPSCNVTSICPRSPTAYCCEY